jgi:hypothetical protein
MAEFWITPGHPRFDVHVLRWKSFALEVSLATEIARANANTVIPLD